MKKLLLLAAILILGLALSSCDAIGDMIDGFEGLDRFFGTTADPAITTTNPAVTTDPAVTTTAAITTATPEEVLDEISSPEKFDNVTIKMAGTVDGDSFDYDICFADGNCLMTDKGSDDTDFFEGEESDMVRAMFIDVALALLDEGDKFTLTSDGYRCDDAITFTTDILGMRGTATIVSSNNLVTLDNAGKLFSLSCNMVQSCDGEVLDVTVTFTFTNYGTTTITPPAAE